MVIESLKTENPFADFGSIVNGNRFVGRKSAIETIKSRVLGNHFGNLAIVGLPRIGKSSLVWNALLCNKQDYQSKKFIICYLDVGKIDNSFDFFKSLMIQAIEELEIYNDKDNIQFLVTIYESIQKEDVSDFDKIQKIQKFFKSAKRFGYRLIFILDEFDNVKRYFRLEDFIFLREIASSPEMKIALVTVSRKTLQEIEPENGSGSKFYGIFTDLRLGLFSENDMVEYWERVKDFKISVSKEYTDRVDYLVGNHPFLIDIVNYYVFQYLSQNYPKSYNDLFLHIESHIQLTLFQSFETSLTLIRDENLYSAAFQLVLGPVYDVTSIEEQKLIKYDFLKKITVEEKEKILNRRIGLQTIEGISYRCFSIFFTEYWNLKFSEVDYWPLWKETENALRDLVKNYLDDKFTSNWEVEFVQKYPKKQEPIQKLIEVREKSFRKFGELASKHLIDNTYSGDIYEIFVSSDWQWFSKIFDGDKGKWIKIFEELAIIRNPIAHNNSDYISHDRLTDAKKSCEKILEKIKNWKDRKV